MTRTPIMLRILVLLSLAIGMPCDLYAADAPTTAATSRPGARGGMRRGGPGSRPSTQPGLQARRDIWAAKLNNPESFNNQGVETYYHKTMISKKINFKGQPETEMGYTIYLPPDYESSQERYPVIYFLHGLGANENTASIVVKKADELIKSKDLPPFIIAAINGGPVFYGNHFEGKFQVHDFFIDEFIPYVDATYRTKADRADRNMMGFSMGGYGATMFAVKHPEMFGAFTDIAGALEGPRSNCWPEMYDSKDENFRPYDIFVLVRRTRKR